MTRKVLVQHQGRDYRVDADDIGKIVKEFGLRGPLAEEKSRLAALGLIYLSTVSWLSGGTGDINDWDRFLTEHQKNLLKPALETIARYHNTPLRDLKYR